MKMLKTIVLLLASTTLTSGIALAQQVGTATAVGPIQQASAAELSHYVNLFTSKPWQNGGVAPD
jgi:hypothetical protein